MQNDYPMQTLRGIYSYKHNYAILIHIQWLNSRIGVQNDYPMQTPSPGAFVTPSPSGYSQAAPPALPYRAPAPARGAMGSHAATPSTHPVPSPSQMGAGSSQRWKFMDDTGKLRKVSGRLFSEPSASLR